MSQGRTAAVLNTVKPGVGMSYIGIMVHPETGKDVYVRVATTCRRDTNQVIHGFIAGTQLCRYEGVEQPYFTGKLGRKGVDGSGFTLVTFLCSADHSACVGFLGGPKEIEELLKKDRKDPNVKLVDIKVDDKAKPRKVPQLQGRTKHFTIEWTGRSFKEVKDEGHDIYEVKNGEFVLIEEKKVSKPRNTKASETLSKVNPVKSVKNTTWKKAATKNAATKNAATKNAATKNAATKNAATKKAATKNAATKKAATKNAATKKAATKSIPNKEEAETAAAV